MKFSLTTTINYSSLDTIIVPLFEGDKTPLSKYGESVAAAAKTLKNAAATGAFERKRGTLFTITGLDNGPTIIVLGMGEAKDISKEDFRQAGGSLAGVIKQHHSKKAALIHAHKKDEIPSLIEGLILGSYSFDRYKSKKTKQQTFSCKVVALNATQTKNLKTEIQKAEILSEATLWARTLSNTPGSDMTPTVLVKEGRALAKATKSTFTALNEAAMAKLGMNALLSVSRGSKEPAYLMTLEYKVAKNAPTIALVGKGLTFDSGGISLKPGGKMNEMKFDMCGGAAVLGAFKAICALKPKVNVICVVPTSENMPSGTATRPGDIVTASNGKTIEIYNTDAEGRLILSDALAYTVKKYKPDAVIDVATLTGACIAALGHIAAAVVSNDDALSATLDRAAHNTGEKVWRLPLWDEYSSMIKGTDADLCNIGPAGQAGTITAACFLKEFIGDTAWAHIDIAGTAWGVSHRTYHSAKGASGYGVRLLADVVTSFEKR